MNTKVKICGIHTAKEASFAISKGADFLGLLVNVPLTNLSITPVKAKNIVNTHLSGKFILLLTSRSVKKIKEIIKYIQPWGVQLLRPSIKIVESLKKTTSVKIMPVIHIKNKRTINKALKYAAIADYLLLDTKSGKYLGGTGLVHDWSISREIIDKSKVPVFLAGGLNKDNVTLAISKTKPYAVDIESSMRNNEGFRDLKRVEEFITIAKNV